MKRRITRAIRARLIAAQRRGHYTKAAQLRRYLKTVQALSREVKHASA